MKTLCIIGSHPRTREQFDFTRTDCDIWVFNEAISNGTIKRADAVFQIHPEAIWRNPGNRNDANHAKWLTTQTDIPVFMQDVYPDVPMSRKYPLEGVLALLNGDPAHMLSSSVAEAVAYAIYLGIYTRVEVWGVAMETNTEYQWQREGVAFWKGFAMGRGIEFYFADPTYECPIYGFEGKTTIPYEKFTDRIAELDPELKRLAGEYQAAIIDVNKAIKLFANDASKEVEQLLYNSVMNQVHLGEQLGILDGRQQETMRYKDKADKMKAAANGEFTFSRQEFESSAKSLYDRTNQENTLFVAEGTRLEIVQRNLQSAAKGSPKRAKLLQTFVQVLQKYLQFNNQKSVYKGASQENFELLAYLDKYVRAAGGARSEAVLLERTEDATV